MARLGWGAGLAVLTALILSGCGGGGDKSAAASYSSLVTFGDSLSDVGTYKVDKVALLGGGKYTVNSATDKNWTELLAAQLGLPAPCAAQTGLDGSYFNAAVTNHVACLNYAQGGSRVTNPVGPGSKYIPDSAALGQLTVPVATQINTHLTKIGGKFSGTELVTVMAGGNDVFMNLGAVGASMMTPTAAVTAMGVAGAELSTYIKTYITGNNAKKVLVLNIPDIKGTPFGQSQGADTQGLIDLMVSTFNNQLKSGLQGTPGVLLIDAYSASKDEVANPAKYGLSNVTGTACKLTTDPNPPDPQVNPLNSSLVCNASNVVAGDVSRYLFADTVHPTPYGYQLMSQLVFKELVLAKWY
jgi:phospholipase/lecithinase/hemolysin